MDIREYKNIIPYGFLLFLLLTGVISIFTKNTLVTDSINSLAIPVFLFSVSILLSKSNKYIRENKFEEISKLESELEKKKDEVSKEVLEKTNEYCIHCKEFTRIDTFTRCINVFAVISFAICPLTMMGIISFPPNCGYINIFSLSLVFFDFFILDDILQKHVHSTTKKIRNKAKLKAKSDIYDGGVLNGQSQ